MAKQTFTVGQVLTAAQLSSLQATALGGGAASAKTASYTLVAADAGTTISMTSTSATTITVNTGLFAAGDTVFIQNLGSGNCTVTAGTATVSTAGSAILPTNDAGILYFVSTGVAIFYDFIQTGAVSPLTTKGDLYTFASSDTRLGVGANDTVLTADSSEATGLKWAAPAAADSMTLLATLSLSGSSVTSSSLSSAYTQWVIYLQGVVSDGSANLNMRLNGDTGNNYSFQHSEIATTLGVAVSTNTTNLIRIGTNTYETGTLYKYNGIITIMRPSDTDSVYIESRGNYYFSGQKQTLTTAIYDNTAAITTFTLFCAADTFFPTTGKAYIYGVK